MERGLIYLKYTLEIYQISLRLSKSHNVKVVPQSVHVRSTIYSSHLKNKINFAAVLPLHVGSGTADRAVLWVASRDVADSAFMPRHMGLCTDVADAAPFIRKLLLYYVIQIPQVFSVALSYASLVFGSF